MYKRQVQGQQATTEATAIRIRQALGNVQGAQVVVSGSAILIQISKICSTTSITEVNIQDQIIDITSKTKIVEEDTEDIITVSSDNKIYKCN